MVDDADISDGDRLGDLRVLVLEAEPIHDLARVVDALGQAVLLPFCGGQLLLVGSHLVQRSEPPVEGNDRAPHSRPDRAAQFPVGGGNQLVDPRQVWMDLRAARQ